MLCCTYSNISHAENLKNALPTEDRVPGGIAIIDLGNSSEKPTVSFNNKPVWVSHSESGYHAILGIPLTAQAGTLAYKVNGKPASIQIAEKEYREQHLTVKKKHSNPSEEQLKRIRKESARSGKAFRSFENRATNADFEWPVKGPISSPFGLKRFFNKQPRRPHSGLDIAAARGTTITAPSAGKITVVGDFFFNGKTVFIDHGHGLITMYCHMDTIAVSEGELIQQGGSIGTVGSTGRATGPHLHWTVSLNNSRVDPMLLLSNN